MPEVSKLISDMPEKSQRCPECNYMAPAKAEQCPVCGYPIAPRTNQPAYPTTTEIKRPPATLPHDGTDTDHIPPHASVILQFLPSGTCVTLALDKPVILGRGAAAGNYEVMDLSGFNALRHGVSRQHCRLERRGNRLIVTDIGSANGTYLNHNPLLPHREYVVAHGDQLVLGTLHLFIAFSTIETA